MRWYSKEMVQQMASAQNVQRLPAFLLGVISRGRPAALSSLETDEHLVMSLLILAASQQPSCFLSCRLVLYVYRPLVSVVACMCMFRGM